MRPAKRWISFSLLAFSLAFLLTGCDTNMVVFEPQGPAARSILHLINWSLVWMLLVVVVVFVLFGVIIWKYRERPENMDYEPPEEHGSTILEIVWTAIPIIIVIALTIPTVSTLYDLEEVPKGYEDQKPLTINVTSADWKWIFSYPEEGIETVNYVNIPEDRPVLFKMTSATTMQSFWIPALAGQKYTMGKMETQLYVVADHPGSYLGRNTNFNGEGYADMEFEVQSQTQADYDNWVKEAKGTAPKLTQEKYSELLKPTHLGRMTFSNTHLAWVKPGEVDPNLKLDPKLYQNHDYPGKIFDYQSKISDQPSKEVNGMSEDMNMDSSEQSEGSSDGGEHHHGN